jgi:hypothetical protein
LTIDYSCPPFDEIRSLTKDLQGWCPPEKCCHIARLIIENCFKEFVEIGVFAGKSLVSASCAFRYLGRGTALGIDPWSNDAALEHMEEDQEYIENWEQRDLERIYRDFIKTVIDRDLTKYCHWIRARSEIAVRMFESDSVDMVHIDGNHSEEMSSLDVRLWLPKVRQSGIILMDDTNEIEWPSTKKAVEMLRESCDLIEDYGDYAVFRKRPVPTQTAGP